MAVPLKTQLRDAIRVALSNVAESPDPSATPYGAEETEVGKPAWEAINVYDSHLDPLTAFCEPDADGNDGTKDLPAIIIYTGQAVYDIDNEASHGNCLRVTLEADVEIWNCGKNGHVLERELDLLEQMVMFKLWRDEAFRQNTMQITAMNTLPSRDPDLNSRFGMRRISLTVVSQDDFTPYLDNLPVACVKLEIRPSENADTPSITTEDILQ